jgi:hypothetical protein
MRWAAMDGQAATDCCGWLDGREPVSLLRNALTLALQESGPTRGHGADETDSALSGIRRLVD